MKVIIVDDEPKAIELLTGYVARFSDLELVATFRNGLKALEYLHGHPVDLVLLDINMPHLNGLAVSRMLNREVRIIFTTAYAEYAVESYEVGATDYLLKPISFERFAKSVTGLLSRQPVLQTKAPSPLYLKSGARWYKLNIADIDYLEKDGNYMYYYCGEKRIMARQTIGQALENLPGAFVQVHKSFIINLDKIEYVDTDQVMLPGKTVPLSPAFKPDLLARLKS